MSLPGDLTDDQPITFAYVLQKMVASNFPYSWITRFNACAILDEELRVATCSVYRIGDTAAVYALFCEWENNRSISVTR